jgi:hypothetical protein
LSGGHGKGAEAHRTAWRYKGGPALSYAEGMDPDLPGGWGVGERLDSVEGYARTVLRDLGMPDRVGWYGRAADGGTHEVPQEGIHDWLREHGGRVSSLVHDHTTCCASGWRSGAR